MTDAEIIGRVRAALKARPNAFAASVVGFWDRHGRISDRQAVALESWFKQQQHKPEAPKQGAGLLLLREALFSGRYLGPDRQAHRVKTLAAVFGVPEPLAAAVLQGLPHLEVLQDKGVE